jgi:hypothetical protein
MIRSKGDARVADPNMELKFNKRRDWIQRVEGRFFKAGGSAAEATSAGALARKHSSSKESLFIGVLFVVIVLMSSCGVEIAVFLDRLRITAPPWSMSDSWLGLSWLLD